MKVWELLPQSFSVGYPCQVRGCGQTIIILAAGLLMAFSSGVKAVVNIGVYDYDKTFTTATDLTYDEYFVSWANFKPSSLTALCNASKAKKRWPVVSVEPWCDSRITPNPANLLSDVIAGKYDAAIRELCADLKKYDGPVIIRWGHEMEMTNNFGRYPWAAADYNAYKAAYIHTNTLFRLYTYGMKQVYYVWSPGGNPNCDAYYPGDAYCDFVACSLYSWGAYDNKYGYDGSFANFFTPKYNLLKVHAKPVMVIECGVANTDNQAAWVTAAKASFANYPLLMAAIYFNAPDSVTWWPGGPVPNWSISPLVWTK
jgi:beta-mannanase